MVLLRTSQNALDQPKDFEVNSEKNEVSLEHPRDFEEQHAARLAFELVNIAGAE
jgi:hypothetical protein